MYEKQMEMFNEGGLKDEGGSVDPVSGNDVPIGSTKEEVRDDIPAMVSEGEFVFPADVVRYIGLNNLMNMRQEAKMGLKKMEAMGQMGNGDEATLPDDMPFGMADIVIVEGSDEPKEMAQGGVIQAQTGTFVTPMFNPSDRDDREYKNAKGESLFIPFLNGQPVYPIPAGYFPVGQTPTETEETETPAPAEDDGGGGGKKPVVNAFTEAGSWAGSPLDMYIKEAEKISAYGNMAAGATAALNPVVGMFVFGALKNEKRKLNNTIDARIKEAEKAGLTDSVAALKAVKKRMSPEGQSVLEQAQSTVIGAFKSLLGIEKGTEESTKVDELTKKAGEINEKTTDAEIEKLSMAGSIDEAVNEGITKPKEEDTVQPETDEGTRFAYPDNIAPKADEEGDALAFANQMDKMGFDYRYTDYNRLDNYAARENYLDEGGRNYEEKEGLLNQPKPENISQDIREYENAQGESLFIPFLNGKPMYPIPAGASQKTIENKYLSIFQNEPGIETVPRIIDPDSNKGKRKVTVGPVPKAEQVTGGVGEIKTRADDIRAYMESIKDPETAVDALSTISDTMSTFSTNAKPMQFARSKSDTEKQTDEVLESGPVIKDTISPGVIADKPNLSAAQETKDRKRRKKQRREKQKAASKALSSFDKNVAGVKSKAGLKNKAAQAGIKKEADKIKSKLEQQEKGITTGFKKGGLASRK